MSIEKEATILNINLKEFIQTIESLNAIKIGEFLQRRYVYDFNPVSPNKWIRLRTNGKLTTITVKEIFDKSKIDGTKELELTVDDFDTAQKLLNELGYNPRNYQENYRIQYNLHNTEISIDCWPLIPAYAEVEGKNVDDVKKVLNLLKNCGEITTLDVESIYRERYGIDVKKIKELKFEGNFNASMLEHNKQM